MTENEEKARKQLTAIIQSNTGLGALRLAAELPKLTDIECKAIACNYPYSFQDIREAFPWDNQALRKGGYMENLNATVGCYQAINLLTKMEKACKIKCYCSLKLLEGNLVMRWLGIFKAGSRKEEKEIGLEIVVNRAETQDINILLDQASRKLDALIKEHDV